MITEQTTIRLIKPKRTAIQIARECYEKWKAPVTFDKDFDDYKENGVVIIRPDLFGLARIIPLGETGEPAWFVRMAVGDLSELLRVLPFYLPKICFCRKQDGRVRVYSLMRMAHLATRRRPEGGPSPRKE